MVEAIQSELAELSQKLKEAEEENTRLTDEKDRIEEELNNTEDMFDAIKRMERATEMLTVQLNEIQAEIDIANEREAGD